MITQTHPGGDRRVLEKVKIRGSSQPMHAGIETTKNGEILTGKGGGGEPGVPRVWTRDLHHGLGGPETGKKLLKARVQFNT